MVSSAASPPGMPHELGMPLLYFSHEVGMLALSFPHEVGMLALYFSHEVGECHRKRPVAFGDNVWRLGERRAFVCR